MSASTYSELLTHVGHSIKCVAYGGKGSPGYDALLNHEIMTGSGLVPDPMPANVAVECVTCGAVLLDFDHPDNASPEAYLTPDPAEAEWDWTPGPDDEPPAIDLCQCGDPIGVHDQASDEPWPCLACTECMDFRGVDTEDEPSPGFAARVLINTDPKRMVPIGCAADSRHRSGMCGGAHAGDAFIAYDLFIPIPPQSTDPDYYGSTDGYMQDRLDNVWTFGNDDQYKGNGWPQVRSLSIGDVVIVEGDASWIKSMGYEHVEPDMLASFTITEAK